MKKSFIILVLMAFAIMPTKADNLKQGEKLVKSLELEFDEQAKTDDVFISWELSGDWDKFDYSFSQGTLEDNVFTIRANEYKGFVNGHEGIALTIEGKSKTEEGDYNLSLRVKEVTDNLDFPKNALNADFQITYILPPPPPLWKQLLIPAIIVLIIVLIAALVFNAQSKFPQGVLQLGQNEVLLKGKKIVSIREELEKLDIQLAEDADVVLVRKKFTTFQGPCIKEIKNCSIECEGNYLTRGIIIYSEQELKGLTDINGNKILIRYC